VELGHSQSEKNVDGGYTCTFFGMLGRIDWQRVDISEEFGGSIFRVKHSKKNLIELPELENGDILFL